MTKELLNADKVIEYKKRDECNIYVVEKNGEDFLVGVFYGRETVYAKVTLSYASWDCENIMYYPFGYFVFAKNDEELIQKIRTKLEELRKNVLG